MFEQQIKEVILLMVYAGVAVMSMMVLDEFNIHPAKESEVKIVDWEIS